MRIALVLLLLCASLYATDAIIAWDANPAEDSVTSYRVYEQIQGSWVRAGDTAALTLTLPSIANGKHTYAVSAINASGEGPRSESAVLPGLPTSPKGVKVSASITIVIPPR